MIGIARHRIGIDGAGVTTLACFSGCPLRCRYCLNPQCFDEATPAMMMTPEELYRHTAVDHLYFLASGGGVTFGGGEPLLRLPFLERFRELCGDEWHLSAETSLHIPAEIIPVAGKILDAFIVDIKDVNPVIYHSYTGGDVTVALSNLRTLLEQVGPERICVRLPLIPGYNTEADRAHSQELLSSLGITTFDRFTYQKCSASKTKTTHIG